MPYVIRRGAKCCNQSDEDKKAEPEVERNWHLVQAAFHGRGVQPPAVVALLASELIALAVNKSEEQVEPAELVGELGFEVSNGITAWAVVLLQGANSDDSFPLADHEHHAVTCSHLTPELSRAALRPWASETCKELARGREAGSA